MHNLKKNNKGCIYGFKSSLISTYNLFLMFKLSLDSILFHASSLSEMFEHLDQWTQSLSGINLGSSVLSATLPLSSPWIWLFQIFGFAGRLPWVYEIYFLKVHLTIPENLDSSCVIAYNQGFIQKNMFFAYKTDGF